MAFPIGFGLASTYDAESVLERHPRVGSEVFAPLGHADSRLLTNRVSSVSLVVTRLLSYHASLMAATIQDSRSRTEKELDSRSWKSIDSGHTNTIE